METELTIVIPANDADLRLLLDHCLLEQALEGTSEELRSRPDWARVPIGMLLRIMESRSPEILSTRRSPPTEPPP